MVDMSFYIAQASNRYFWTDAQQAAILKAYQTGDLQEIATQVASLPAVPKGGTQATLFGGYFPTADGAGVSAEAYANAYAFSHSGA